MRTLTRSLLLATVVAGLVLTNACGSSGDDDVVASGGTDGDTPTSSPSTVVTLDPTATTAAIAWTRIEPTEDLTGAVVAEPQELVADPDDDRVVLVHFYGGVQDCYGANATVVTQDATTVEIRLETGSLPDAGDRACIEIAEAQELAVTLDAPVGDRTLTAAPAV